jgi:hypothetical protein
MHHAPIQSTQDGVEVIFFFLVARLPHLAVLDTPELAGCHLTLQENLAIGCAMNGKEIADLGEQLNAVGVEDEDIFMAVWDGLNASDFVGPDTNLPAWVSFSLKKGRLYALSVA